MDKKLIQELLNAWISQAGMRLTELKIDGNIGKFSKETIMKFQKAHNLKVDGIPGVNTQYKLMFYKYPNFREQEFACKCGKCGGFPVKVDEKLLILLNKIRDKFEKPVHITSAIRCVAHNKIVGGVSDSQHLKGNSADIKIQGTSPDVVYDYADLINHNGGVGKYNTFTHVDTRGKRARW